MWNMEVEDREARLGRAILTSEEQIDQEHIDNLDTFFVRLYAYFRRGGSTSIIVSRVMELLTLGFTVLFSTFVLVYIDWHSLWHCTRLSSCAGVSFIRSNALEDPSFAVSTVLLYFSVMVVYWLWNLVSLMYTTRHVLRMRHFFVDKLEITDEQLQSLEWHEVVDRLVQLQKHVKLCITKDLTPLDITNRILRRDNFMVALVNMNVLDLSVPGSKLVDHYCGKQGPLHAVFCGCTDACLDENQAPMEEELDNVLLPPIRSLSDPTVSGAAYSSLPDGERHSPKQQNSGPAPHHASGGWVAFGSTLEWNIRFCILDAMFDERFTVRDQFKHPAGVSALKRRFIFMGLVNLVLMPFILMFMVLFFFLRHAEEFHRKKSYLGPHEWTTMAKWKLREFNELSHFFEHRLRAGYEPAEQFISQFPTNIATPIAQFVSYVAGAFVAILLLLAFIDTQIVSDTHVWERPLLWWLAIFSAILATSRTFIPEKVVLVRPEQAMQKVVAFTHFYPPHWVNRCHTSEVRAEFLRLFKAKIMVLVGEIVSVLTTPFVLFFSLPSSASRLIEFVRDSTVTVDGVGDVCVFAMFDLEQRGGSESFMMRLGVPVGYPNDHRVDIDSETTRTGPGPTEQAQSSDSTFSGGADEAAGGLMPPEVSQRPGERTRGLSDAEAAVASRARWMMQSQGKMEKSFLTFAINHPTYKMTAPGAEFVNSVLSLSMAPHRAFGARLQSSVMVPVGSPEHGNEMSMMDSAMAGSTMASMTLNAPLLTRATSGASDTDSSDDGVGAARSPPEAAEQRPEMKSSVAVMRSSALEHSLSDLLGWNASQLLPEMARMEASGGIFASLLAPSAEQHMQQQQMHQHQHQQQPARNNIMAAPSFRHPAFRRPPLGASGFAPPYTVPEEP